MEALNPSLTRLHKDISAKDQKIAKQEEEIVRLKSQIKELKSSNSRVRRIPKKPAQDAATEPADPASA